MKILSGAVSMCFKTGIAASGTFAEPVGLGDDVCPQDGRHQKLLPLDAGNPEAIPPAKSFIASGRGLGDEEEAAATNT